MIFGDRLAKTKLVEQLTLFTLQTAHHGSTPPRFASTQRNHASRPVSTDFCNKIGTSRTWLIRRGCPLLSERQTLFSLDLRLAASGAKRPVGGVSAPGGRTDMPRR